MQLLIFTARRIVLVLTLGGLGILAWYSVLSARADVAFRENNPAAARDAVRLVPANAAYHELLAEHLEAAGADPDAELEIATHLSPYESRFWIRRAFRAEVEQKYADSERFLLEADRVDRGFDPRWALMNYYFRRGRYPEFWKSTREALDISYGNLDPVFRLCLAANDNPAVTRRVLPPRRRILFAFFTYLKNHERLAPAATVVDELAPGAQQEEVAELIDYCVRQSGRDNASSLAVWNAMCSRRLLPFAELSPDNGRLVTNGDFAATPLQQAFDWKYGTDAGITVGQTDIEPGLSVGMSGQQPDRVLLIAQEIPLTPGKQYFVNYEYRLVGAQQSGAQIDSGVRWAVQENRPDAMAGAEPIAVSSVLSASDWANGQIAFSSGQRDSARLILEYRRAPGTLRWKGTVQLRRVSSGLAERDLPGPGSAR